MATEHINERLLLYLNDRYHKISDIFSNGAHTATTYTPNKYTLQSVQPFKHSYYVCYRVANIKTLKIS